VSNTSRWYLLLHGSVPRGCGRGRVLHGRRRGLVADLGGRGELSRETWETRGM
jgi:hypothetical protein